MVLEQADHRERHPGGDQGVALLPHVTPVLDRLHDGRVGGRPPDAQLLEPFHQRRLGVASRWGGGVVPGLEVWGGQPVALGHGRQDGLAVLQLGGRVVGALDVGPQVAREGDGAPRGGPLGVGAVARRRADAHGHAPAAGVGHLGGDGPLPDELVEAQVVAPQLGAQRVRGAEALARRADGLVGLLGVLHLAVVEPGRVRQVLGAVELADLAAGGGQRRLRQVERVGAHVGDVAPLVEPLGHPHHLGGRQPQLAPALLLQRRGHERRLGRAAERLLLHAAHGEAGAVEGGLQAPGGGLVEHGDVGAPGPALVVEVLAGGDLRAVHAHEGGGEPRVGREGGGQVPVAGRHEAHPLALALDHQSDRRALHAAGGEATVHLAPQHPRNRVAEQAVDDAAGLLGVDQAVVDVAPVGHGVVDGGRGDLVEDHPLDRHPGLQLLQQVPGDGLALTVLVGGEQQLVGVAQGRLEPAEHVLLLVVDHIGGLEAVLHVDAEPLGLQVADVADGGFDHVVPAEEPRDGARLGRGLHDHQGLGHAA